MTKTPEEISQCLLAAARAAGAEAADAIVIDSSSVSVEVRAGALEHAERSEGTDLGLRVFLGHRQAIVSSSDSRPETLAAMAERAVAMAAETPEDPFSGLADPDQLARGWDIDALELFDPTDEPTAETLMHDALRAEAAALAVSGVTQVSDAAASFGTHHVHVAATNGFSGGYSRTNRSISCVAISGEGTGMERDYDGDSRTFQADLRNPEDIGRPPETASSRASARASPKRARIPSFSTNGFRHR